MLLLFCFFVFTDKTQLEQKKNESAIIEDRLTFVKKKMTQGLDEKDFNSLKKRLLRLETLLNHIEKYHGDKDVLSETLEKYKAYKKQYDAQLQEIQTVAVNTEKKKSLMSWLSPEGLIELIRRFLWIDEIKKEDLEKTAEILEKRKKELDEQIENLEKKEL